MGTTKQRCYCGEANCRGYLGAKDSIKPKPENEPRPVRKAVIKAKKLKNSKKAKKRSPVKKKPVQRNQSSPKTKKKEKLFTPPTAPPIFKPAHCVLADSKFSISSHLPYFKSFDINNIPDKDIVTKRKIFLLRNVRKTHKNWTKILQR